MMAPFDIAGIRRYHDASTEHRDAEAPSPTWKRLLGVSVPRWYVVLLDDSAQRPGNADLRRFGLEVQIAIEQHIAPHAEHAIAGPPAIT